MDISCFLHIQHFFTSQKLFTFKPYLLLLWAKVLINPFIINTAQFSFNPLPEFTYYFPGCFTYIYFPFICLNCALLLLSLLSQGSANLSPPVPFSTWQQSWACPSTPANTLWEPLTWASSPPGSHKHSHFITATLLGNSSYVFINREFWREKKISKIKMGIFLEPKQLDKQNFSISRSVQGSLCVGNLPSATLTWKPGGTGSACIDPMVSVVFHSSALSRSFFFFFFIWNLHIKKSLSHN